MGIRHRNLDALAAALREDVSRRLILRRLAGGLVALVVVGGTRRVASAQEASRPR